MKRILLPILLAASPLAAEEDFCQTVGIVAETVMMARQAELPQSELRQIFVETIQEGAPLAPSASTVRDEFINRVILDAYRRTSYTSSSVQNRVIAKFVNEWENKCYSGELGIAN